ncbi:helix-turn-helix transcriptional regulator [Ottowia sp.]|uniref:helix-turn-helix domain-containing protein n=1 Tax=Ottowia sp. TaxID=1898956 RepID=UPI0025D0B7B6|nr:helix-turn-helix transcriptional regulator [Ottowia sp.]MBK6614187.1 helix-turn-helix domain-containing protein [Ottowia sp.]
MVTTKKPSKRGSQDVESDLPLLSLARQVRSWTDTLLGVAGNATDMSMTLAQARIRDPEKKAAATKAGSQLRKWREAAGMTATELGDAIGLGDAKLIEQAEGGVASLPFDVVLRLAGVLGRHDPLPVAMGLTRQYNPELWKALEAIGVGRLAVQGTRERELANIYRGNDAARALDDARFAQVLAFTKQAFDMTVEFSDRPASFADLQGSQT